MQEAPPFNGPKPGDIPELVIRTVSSTVNCQDLIRSRASAEDVFARAVSAGRVDLGKFVREGKIPYTILWR